MMMTARRNCNLCTLLVGMRNVIITFENSLAVPPRVKYRVITYMGSLVAQMVKHLPEMWETRVRSLSRETSWRRKWQPTPVLLPRKFHGWRSLVGYSRPWGLKEPDTTERLHLHLQSHI